jgi:hypothetical protein
LNSKDSALITSLIGGVIGHYSCSNGDTWSSEIGVLSDDRPRLITTFKVNNLFVQASTNIRETGSFYSYLAFSNVGRLNKTLGSVVAAKVLDVLVC